MDDIAELMRQVDDAEQSFAKYVESKGGYIDYTERPEAGEWATPYKRLSVIYRKQKDYEAECNILHRYFLKIGVETKGRANHDLRRRQDRACELHNKQRKAQKKEQEAARRHAEPGQCERCGVGPRVRKKLVDGRAVCNKCFKDLCAYDRLWESGIKLRRDTDPEAARKLEEDIHKAYHYVLDLWEKERGVRIIYDHLAGEDPRGSISEFVEATVKGDLQLVRRIAAIQSQREEVAKQVASARGQEWARRSPLERTADYMKVKQLLLQRWPGFLNEPPRNPCSMVIEL